MNIRGAAFYFLMFSYFSFVFVVCRLWVLVCVIHGMLVPKSKTSDGALFLRFFYIVKTTMMRRDWQCTWWWMEMNTKKRRKLSTFGFRLIFYFMFMVLLLWILGRMHEFNYVKDLPINFINFVALRLVNKTLCVSESIGT